MEEEISLEDVTPKPLEPRFLTIQLSNTTKTTFKNVSPFAQKRGLLLLAGEVKNSKCLKDGTLLVEVESCEQSRKLQAATTFDTMPIKVTPHKMLNSSKGLVFCHDLLDLDVEEIQKELASQRVTEVFRMMSRKTGTLKPTPLLLLTFGTPKLPEFIFAGYLRLNVRPHIPNPLRCFKCQIYGHPSDGCSRKSVCGKCSSEEHETDNCSNSPHCVNCSGSHPVWSRDCPQWVLEKRIQELKVTENISLFEARKRLNVSANSSKKSFANATNSSVAVSAETAQLQAMLAQQLQLSADQAKRHEEMEERHKQEVATLKNQLEEKGKEIDSLKLQVQELLEARTLQLAHAKLANKQTGLAKKTPITFDPNNVGGSTSSSLSIRKDGMEIDPTDASPNNWQTVKGKEKGRISHH